MNGLPTMTSTGATDLNGLLFLHEPPNSLWAEPCLTGASSRTPTFEFDVTTMFLRKRPLAETLVHSIRDGLGLTIGQIARALGKTRQAVHGWMRGESLEDANLANLRELAHWSAEWAKAWPSRTPDSTAWTESFLKSVADAGASSEAGRALWLAFLQAQNGTALRRSKIPSVVEIDRVLGSEPSSELKKSQRLADNIGSLRRDARKHR